MRAGRWKATYNRKIHDSGFCTQVRNNPFHNANPMVEGDTQHRITATIILIKLINSLILAARWKRHVEQRYMTQRFKFDFRRQPEESIYAQAQIFVCPTNRLTITLTC